MYTTHNAVRDTIEKILRRAGCTTVSEPVGELEPHIDAKGKAHELRVDIRADGLRANSTTLLLDTSITHIIGKAKDPASQPQARQGKSHPKANPIKAAETLKDGKYKEAALRAHKEFIPLVMDTYGGMGNLSSSC